MISIAASIVFVVESRNLEVGTRMKGPLSFRFSFGGKRWCTSPWHICKRNFDETSMDCSAKQDPQLKSQTVRAPHLLNS